MSSGCCRRPSTSYRPRPFLLLLRWHTLTHSVLFYPWLWYYKSLIFWIPSQDAELLSSRYKSAMSSVLADSRLVQLQQEGGASLSWLRREAESKAWSAPVEKVSSLYNQVDELLHCLVTLSNTRTRQLSFILDFSSLEQELTEVSNDFSFWQISKQPSFYRYFKKNLLQ